MVIAASIGTGLQQLGFSELMSEAHLAPFFVAALTLLAALSAATHAGVLHLLRGRKGGFPWAPAVLVAGCCLLTLGWGAEMSATAAAAEVAAAAAAAATVLLLSEAEPAFAANAVYPAKCVGTGLPASLVPYRRVLPLSHGEGFAPTDSTARDLTA